MGAAALRFALWCVLQAVQRLPVVVICPQSRHLRLGMGWWCGVAVEPQVEPCTRDSDRCYEKPRHVGLLTRHRRTSEPVAHSAAVAQRSLGRTY